VLRPYRLAYDGAWHIDWPSVMRARSQRTRALLVVNPSNPTGNFLSPYDVERWQQLGDVPLVCDEVFGMYSTVTSAGNSVLSLVGSCESEGQLVVALDGLSKSCLMPQAKLAWMTLAGEPGLVEEAMQRLELLNDAWLSASTVTQGILAQLLERGQGARLRVRDRLAFNLAHLRNTTQDSPITLYEPEGGWYAVLRLPAVVDEERWALQLLQQSGTVVQPGYFYDFEQHPLCVVSLLTPESTFAAGCAHITASIARATGGV